MTSFDIVIIGIVAITVVVAVVALRFPRGRADWPMDARQTAWLLVSAATGVAVFVLLYVATRDWRWPGAVTTTFAAVAISLVALLAISIFLPQGLRTRP